jgi:hypothetical protein
MNNSRIPGDPGAWDHKNPQGYLTCLNHLTLPMGHDMTSESHSDICSMIGFDQMSKQHLSKWSLGNELLMSPWTVALTSQRRRVLSSMALWSYLKMILGHGFDRIEPPGEHGMS